MAEAEDGSGRVVDWFAVLGCSAEATDTEVRRAYRALARSSHPDRGGDPADFARANQAYELLRTGEQRAELAVRLRAQGRRDAMRGGGQGPTAAPADPSPRPTSRPSASGRPTSGRPTSGRPTSPGRSEPVPPASRPRREQDGTQRLSQEEQDRLLGEFWASHPDVSAREARPASEPVAAPLHRRRSRLGRLLLAAGALVLVGFLAQPLLPDGVQDRLDEVVEAVLP